MASHFFFNGRLHTTPIAVSSVDDSRMSPQNPAVGNNLALIGLADAGKPQTALTFSNPREAERELRGGELLTAVRKAFAPSASTSGPAQVTVVRVEPATTSTLTLLDASSQPCIILNSDIYGLLANQIRIQVETGTDFGKMVTSRLGNDYYLADNLGRKIMRVRYSGVSASALLTVTATTAVLKAGTLGSEVTIATINLVDTPVVQQLADRINSYTGFTATVDAGAALKPTNHALDGLAAVDCKTADAQVTADLQEVINWFNSAAEGYCTATRPNAATKPPANIGYTYLTGATSPVPQLSDWSSSFDVMTTQDVQWLVPLSSDPAVHAMADAHCVFMSDAGRKERRCFVGPALGLTVDAVKLLPHTIASDRTALVWPGHYDVDLTTGDRTLLPPYMSAVLVAGGFAGLAPGNAMTNRTVKISGLEYNPTFPADTDKLINNGVLTFENTPRGFKVVRSVSTWLENDNFNRVEVSCGSAVDYVVRAVREALEPLVGSKASPQVLARAAQVTESVLKSLARPEPGGPGVIVGDGAAPAYQNIQVAVAGDVLEVAFECSPVVPLNFIAIAVSVAPYRGTLRINA